ncbi:MAG: hypothetical protein OEV74_21135 [Cyclobacteriaceae bacterium]|nr:hypothetical protein [Cyclobacteriaceae bacterium]MDH4298790.1 hypothetical protein [Cyclobacteriaceae bacterium]MDH5251083.1 hypothetical protein [Cyclobacteriaceae bacterium]
MKKFLVIIFYSLACSLPFVLLAFYFEVDSWWVEIIIIAFSLFMGSFFYTQLHGIQVMQLKYLGSVRGTHKFRILVRIGIHGKLNMLGDYRRAKPFSDFSLQKKLHKTFNTDPGNGWIKGFASDKEVMIMTVTVEDLEHPVQVNVEKKRPLGKRRR